MVDMILNMLKRSKKHFKQFLKQGIAVFTLCFISLGFFGGSLNENLTPQPVDAAWDTGVFEQNWHENNTLLEGWSGWTWDDVGNYGGRSIDYFWLKQISVDSNGNITFQTQAGQYDNMGLGWKHSFLFYVNGVHKSTIAPAKTTKQAYTGHRAYYNTGSNIVLAAGKSYTIEIKVTNSSSGSQSLGKVVINVPKPSFQLKINYDSGISSVSGAGRYTMGTNANVTYNVKPGYHIVKTTGTNNANGSVGTWTDKAGQTGAVKDTWWIGNYDRTITVYTERNKAHIDVNGVVDGKQIWSNLPGTFDVYVNGSRVATGVRDFGGDYTIGQKWEIKNIKPDAGYRYYDGSTSGTLGENGVSPNLYFQKENYISYNTQGGSINNSINNPSGYKLINNGYYSISSAIDGNKYIHVSNMNLNDGGRICIYSGGGSAYQTLWYFQRYKDTPYYFIISKLNGKALNLVGNTSVDLSNSEIELYSQLDGEANPDFLWALRDQGNGYVSIVNKHTGKVMDLKSADTTNGNTIWQYIINNSNAQKWKLTAIDTNGDYPKQRKVASSPFFVNTSVPVKNGYRFIKWTTRPDGTGDSFQPGQQLKPDVTTTLYAQWEIANVRNGINHWMWGFKNQEGNNGPKNAFNFANTSVTNVNGTQFVMDESQAARIPNGFQLDNEFGTSSVTGSWQHYPMGTKITQKPTGMSFEYDYSPIEYKINYDLNGGSNNNSSNPSTYNVLYGVTLKAPTRTGYTFKGWKDTATGQIITGINEGQNATFSSVQDMYDKLSKRTAKNLNLEAQWQASSFTATFNANGGNTASPEKIVKKYGEPLGTLPTTQRTGHVFTGWYTAATGGTKIDSTTTMPPQNVTYYAHWELKDIHITFNGNGGNVHKTDGSQTATMKTTYKYGQAISAPSASRKHYKFTGWYTDPLFGDKLTSTTKAQYDTTYYAHWEVSSKLTAKDFFLIEGQKADTNVEITGNGYDKSPTKKFPNRLIKVNYPVTGQESNGTLIPTSDIVVKEILFNGKRVTSISTATPGEYEVTYELKGDSTITTKRKITVLKKSTPEINASDKYFRKDTAITQEMLLSKVTANDKYDGDILNKVVIKDADKINSKQVGDYKITYEVTNSSGVTTKKTVTIHIIEFMGDLDNYTNDYQFVRKECSSAAIKGETAPDYCIDYLSKDSKWKKPGVLQNSLKNSLNRNKKEEAVKVYNFNKNDVNAAKNKARNK